MTNAQIALFNLSTVCMCAIRWNGISLTINNFTSWKTIEIANRLMLFLLFEIVKKKKIIFIKEKRIDFEHGSCLDNVELIRNFVWNQWPVCFFFRCLADQKANERTLYLIHVSWCLLTFYLIGYDNRNGKCTKKKNSNRFADCVCVQLFISQFNRQY